MVFKIVLRVCPPFFSYMQLPLPQAVYLLLIFLSDLKVSLVCFPSKGVYVKRALTSMHTEHPGCIQHPR